MKKILLGLMVLSSVSFSKEYLLSLEVKQSHFSLNIGTHLKDHMNRLELELPVSENFYHQVKIGDVLQEEFRVGSAIMKGSFGTWKIKVIGKREVE